MNIKNLPQYEPEDWLWRNIESELNLEEAEQQKLRAALQRLPQYAPPTLVWNGVGNILQSIDNEDIKLKNALQKLPQHTPQNGVWLGVIQELPSRQTAILRSIFTFKTAMAAATIAFLCTVGIYFYNQKTSDHTSIAFTQETVSDEILKNNTNSNQDDEKAFAMVDEICKERAFVCEQPEVQSLKAELTELNAAQAELKEAIGSYGTDESLLQQLRSVESERTEILKKIVSII